MTSITLPRSKTNEGLAFSHSGKGMPVVLIHGVGLRSESWYYQVEELKKQYSVFTVDMPGHGESDLFSKHEPSLYDFTEKMARFIIDEVQEPAIIIGHSMGALLSLSLAKEYPELCLAIVAMNTVYKRSTEAKRAVQNRAADLIDFSHADACAPIARWFNDPPSHKDRIHAVLCRQWLLSANLEGYAAAYKVFAAEDGPATTAISRLAMPVLYMTGELDLNSNISMTHALAKITPDAEAVIIKDSRHMTPLTHGKEVNEVLLGFLNRRLSKTDASILN